MEALHFRSEETSIPKFGYGTITSLKSSSASSRHGLASRSLWEDFMELNQSRIYEIPSFSLMCFSTNKFAVGTYLAYVYKDVDTLKVYGTVGEVYLQQAQYDYVVGRRTGCRYLFDKDSLIYEDVVKTENIVNPSFTYAKATWDNAENSKYVMYEFLITLLVIMSVFAYVINSMTLNIEKKKIGIKYSFGISKLPIIVPYLLETLLYIVTGIIFSLLIVRVIYPFIVTNFIYTSTQELLEYEFYYISSMSVFGWDLVVYSIMSLSLIAMILSICRKSPIEIIKDL